MYLVPIFWTWESWNWNFEFAYRRILYLHSTSDERLNFSNSWIPSQITGLLSWGQATTVNFLFPTQICVFSTQNLGFWVSGNDSMLREIYGNDSMLREILVITINTPMQIVIQYNEERVEYLPV